MHQYKLISKKGEGTFSEVLKAQSIKKNKYVAIKCMKNHFSSIDKVHNLREIQALKKLSPHEHIIKLIEILYDEPTGRLALVFELMDCNLYEHIKGRKHYLHPQKVKFYIFQLLKAIDHMHRNGIFHRDIKPENILLCGDHLKLADFGSCKGMYSEHPYTEYISTRWYRAPECLMTDGYYDYKMDLWGTGCVMFEVITLFPLFPGKNELDQVHKIHKILGTPDAKIIERFKKRATHMEFNFPQEKGSGIEKYLPHASPDCIDLMKQLLTYDPEQRITAAQALRHEYFRDIYESDVFQSMLFTMKQSTGRKPGGLSGDESRNDSLPDNSDGDKGGYVKKQGHNYSNSIKGAPKNGAPEMSMAGATMTNTNVNSSTGVNSNSNTTNLPDKQVMFPPIKNSLIHLDQKPGYKQPRNPNKQYDPKKLYGSLKKPLNQTFKSKKDHHFFQKDKIKKDQTMYNAAADYVLSGKKANIAQFQ